MKKHPITVEATLLEPEGNELLGAFLIAASTLHRPGQPDLHCGSSGGNLYLYLDNERAVQIDGIQLYEGAMKALAESNA